MRRKGKLITVEGIDGVGKTTQVKLLTEWLIQKGFPVVPVREPGGTVVSEKIRRILLDPGLSLTGSVEVLLYAAARAQLTAEVISPALERAAIVVCDRFLDSSIAYQGYGRELGSRAVLEINRFAFGELEPDLTILLDLTPEQALERAQRNRIHTDRIENEKIDFYRRVREGYLAQAVLHSSRVALIYASRPVSEIHDEIKILVNKFLYKD